MILTDNQFSQTANYTNPTQDIRTLLDPTCVDLFDQNGYHLTKAEQTFLLPNGYNPIERRHEDVLRKDWFVWNSYNGVHINHSDLFERKGFADGALDQLVKYAEYNPMLYKLIKMKPKWGIDISIDYVSKDAVFEVFHYEWDAFEFQAVQEKKKEIENFILKQDWYELADELWRRKDEWYYLDFHDQTKWRTDLLGLPPEKFKNVIWDI
jgi:hypothetical protein